MMHRRILSTLIVGSLGFGTIAQGYAQDTKQLIEQSVSQNNDKFVKIFKDIHQNPELGT